MSIILRANLRVIHDGFLSSCLEFHLSCTAVSKNEVKMKSHEITFEISYKVLRSGPCTIASSGVLAEQMGCNLPNYFTIRCNVLFLCDIRYQQKTMHLSYHWVDGPDDCITITVVVVGLI